MCGFCTPAPPLSGCLDTHWWPTAPLGPDSDCPEVAQAPQEGAQPPKTAPTAHASHKSLPASCRVGMGGTPSSGLITYCNGSQNSGNLLLGDWFITKDTGEQPDAEVCGMRSGRVWSAGASVLVELGVPPPSGCVHQAACSKPFLWGSLGSLIRSGGHS